MTTKSPFDAAKRSRFLTLLEKGATVQEAADQSDVHRGTPYAWVKRGREPKASAEYVEFAEAFESVRNRTCDSRLEKTDLVVLLERRAAEGNVAAIRELLRIQELEEAAKAAAQEARRASKAEEKPKSKIAQLAQRRKGD